MQQFDRAEAIPTGSRLLHIGPAKTGTTTLQGALHNQREKMAAHGVVYAGSRRHSRSAMVGIAYAKTPPGYPADAKQRWAKLAKQVRNSTADRIILSSEVLARLSPSRARMLVEDLGGPTHLVLTLRPLAHILASRWQQSVQDAMSQSYSEWLAELFEMTPGASGKPSFWLRYDLARHLARWGPIVGVENITFVILDPNDRSMLLRSFEELLALPAGTLVPDVALTNPSLGHPEIEMLATFNRSYAEDGRGREEFIQAVRGKAAISLKADPDRLSTARIQTPRWAAVAANERAQDWITAVRSSDARVVGNLEHLLVDPEAYPEVATPPTSVSTESAGEMAYRLYKVGYEHGVIEGGRAMRAEQRAARAAAAPGKARRTVDWFWRR